MDKKRVKIGSIGRLPVKCAFYSLVHSYLPVEFIDERQFRFRAILCLAACTRIIVKPFREHQWHPPTHLAHLIILIPSID